MCFMGDAQMKNTQKKSFFQELTGFKATVI